MTRVTVLIGIPGSGKTTLATRLARRLHCTVLSRDRIRAAMFDPCRFTSAEKEAAFEALLIALGTCLKLKHSCLIIDGMPFSKRRQLERVHEVCRLHRAAPMFLHLRLPVELAQQRVESDRHSRRNRLEDRTGHLVSEVHSRFEKLPDYVTTIDATMNKKDLLAAALAAIGPT